MIVTQVAVLAKYKRKEATCGVIRLNKHIIWVSFRSYINQTAVTLARSKEQAARSTAFRAVTRNAIIIEYLGLYGVIHGYIHMSGIHLYDIVLGLKIVFIDFLIRHYALS